MKRVVALAAAAMIAVTGQAMAEWPEKPIKVVVPFKAGGTSDQTGRIYQQAIKEGEILSQPITVLNVGGHYSIGSRQVMEAEADGYTFLLVHIALMGGEGSGAMDFGWRDFEPVAATGEFCVLPMVRKDSGINTVQELLEKAKEEPDTLIFGANLGAINHMAGIMMEQANPGTKFRFVQIGGGTANFTALTGAQTDTTVLSGAEVVKFTLLPDGSDNPESQIKALAYTGAERLPALPDLPTMKEAGYDMEFCIKSWWFAPKGTPQEAIDGFAEALGKSMETDVVKSFNEERYFTPVFLAGDELMDDLNNTWTAIEPVAKLAAQK
ncbi:MAG: tripartite tricarboxylate transporter substrate binding protein [Hyphomicrobiales bacterium]|nr:tripartite tricarboxylate transporter substrate binding protein [Hyphomicrobiales bacterium]